jgi:hypothetical protein
VEILRENARSWARDETPVDTTPRPNRRRFDYLLVLTVANGLLAWRLVAGWGNPFVMMFCVAGIALFTAGVTRVMYVVMDRY